MFQARIFSSASRCLGFLEGRRVAGILFFATGGYSLAHKLGLAVLKVFSGEAMGAKKLDPPAVRPDSCSFRRWRAEGSHPKGHLPNLRPSFI